MKNCHPCTPKGYPGKGDKKGLRGYNNPPGKPRKLKDTHLTKSKERFTK